MNAVEEELAAFRALLAAAAGTTAVEQGFSLRCAAGVLPPCNRVTRCLAQVVADHDAETVLDLGSGSGLLALVASRRAREVVATDLDPRAVAAARFNARASDNVRVLAGDLFAPVADRRFDLIVCNPPFYEAIGPAPRALCEDVTRPFLTRFLRGLGGRLSPAGRAMFVTSSLTDNARVERLARANGLIARRELLHRGRGGSQDVFLWRARAAGGT